MAEQMKKNSSALPSLLRYVLDELGVFATREQWAKVLGVSLPAISKWVNGETIPSPEHLRSVARTLSEDERVSEDVLKKFDELAQQPLNEVVPEGRMDRPEPTLGHYMTRPLRESFLRALDTLPPASQEEVILQASNLIRSYRDRKPQRWVALLVRRRPIDAAREAAAKVRANEGASTSLAEAEDRIFQRVLAKFARLAAEEDEEPKKEDRKAARAPSKGKSGRAAGLETAGA